MRFAMVPRAFLRYATFFKIAVQQNRNYLKHSSKDIRGTPSAFEVARGLRRFIFARAYKKLRGINRRIPSGTFWLYEDLLTFRPHADFFQRII